jgi:hypothetical protein
MTQLTGSISGTATTELLEGPRHYVRVQRIGVTKLTWHNSGAVVARAQCEGARNYRVKGAMTSLTRESTS